MNISSRKLISVINNARKWIMDSGIQNVDIDPSINGSYNAWFDSDTGGYPYLYSEICGYLITLM